MGALCLMLHAWADGPLHVGVVLDKGGKDDRSFNAAACVGMLRAKNELGADVKIVEAIDDNAFEHLLRSFTQRSYDLIISVGVAQTSAMKKMAQKFPEKHFMIVDGEIKAPNVRSVLFQEQEGSFLVGAIAAMTSQSNKIGFLGGMDIPIIRRFEMGYRCGARFVRPKIQVLTHFVGVTADAWNNPPKAKEIALTQYQMGADVIFGAAGASGAGIFDAAEHVKKFAIGVDSNQNWVKPGRILTSMEKRVDEVVFAAIKDAQKGHFQAGVFHLGLAQKGVGYSLDTYNQALITPTIKKEIDTLSKAIIAGTLKVPDFYVGDSCGP